MVVQDRKVVSIGRAFELRAEVAPSVNERISFLKQAARSYSTTPGSNEDMLRVLEEVNRIEAGRTVNRVMSPMEQREVKLVLDHANRFRRIPDYRSAVDKYREAVSICERARDPVGIRATKMEVADTYMEAGNWYLNKKRNYFLSEAAFANAAIVYEEIGQIDKATQIRMHIAKTRTRLGDRAFEFGDLDKATEHFNFAETLYRSMGMRDEADAVAQRMGGGPEPA